MAFWSVFTLFLTSLGFARSEPNAEDRYRDLNEAAARHRESNLPWQTFRKFAPEFQRLAEEAPDEPAALSALLAAGEYGSQCIDTCNYDGKPHSRIMERALDRIASDRLTDERVGRLCLVLSRLPSPARESFLRRVLRESKDLGVQGRACLGLAELLKTKLACAESLAAPSLRETSARSEITWGSDYLAELRGCDRAVLRAEAESLLVRVVEEFADVPFVRGTAETPVWRATAAKDIAAKKTLSMVAQADLDELRHLAPGCIASEIEGRDADNIPYKLSDYRGKVVVLSFSGNWCGPCRSMYPYERELVARLSGRKFALLSVNTDENVDTLRESIRKGDVTWRCWWDGGPGGPVSSRWNIRAWPTIYVLDATGVIRAKNPSIEGALDTLIDGLLEAGSDATGAAQRK